MIVHGDETYGTPLVAAVAALSSINFTGRDVTRDETSAIDTLGNSEIYIIHLYSTPL